MCGAAQVLEDANVDLVVLARCEVLFGSWSGTPLTVQTECVVAAAQRQRLWQGLPQGSAAGAQLGSWAYISGSAWAGLRSPDSPGPAHIFPAVLLCCHRTGCVQVHADLQ